MYRDVSSVAAPELRGALLLRGPPPTAAPCGGSPWVPAVDDPVAEVAKISERGLEPVEDEKHDTVWKYIFHDADGNETGIGGDVSFR